MTDHNSEAYQEGLRDGRLLTLEKTVAELTVDMKAMKKLLAYLYGAIALGAFLPTVIQMFEGWKA